MDLSKVFDWVPHDLHVRKMAAYRKQNENFSLFFAYLTYPKQCVKISNNSNTFKKITSGTRLGCILVPGQQIHFFVIEANYWTSF